MSEKDMRRRVITATRPLHGLAVENPVYPGTPDVNTTEGWIELKWLRSWPKRSQTIVELNHYTIQQRLFARKRQRAGQRCWLMLQCRREWFLYDGVVAANHVGRSTRQELIDHAYHYWPDGLNDAELVQLVKNESRL